MTNVGHSFGFNTLFLGSLAYPVIHNSWDNFQLSIVRYLNNSDHNMRQMDAYDIVKKELLLFGPVSLTFSATEEFLHYSEGMREIERKF